MDVQGWVVMGLALVLFGYLVPHLVHSRQQLAEARVEDRFSRTLRVVTTGATAKRSSATEHHGTRESRPYLHDPRRRTEAPAVNRPTTPSERAAAEARRLAQLRAARAAEISRRKAAAKRRLVLTVVLLLASVGGWLGFGLGSLSVALGVVPTVLLGGVLVLGRRAAKIAARRNAADRAAMARLELRPAPRTRPATSARTATAARTTTATAPRTTTTATRARTTTAASRAAEPAPAEPVGEEAGSAIVEDAAGAAAGDTVEVTGAPAKATQQAWTPVPVPAPAYTLKAPAPRRDIAPYEAPAPQPAAAQSPAAPVAEAQADSVAEAAAERVAEVQAGGVAEASAERVAEVQAGGVAEAPPERVVAAAGLAGSPYGPVADPEPQTTPAPEAPPARGLDLDSVLARRRAVGA